MKVRRCFVATPMISFLFQPHLTFSRAIALLAATGILPIAGLPAAEPVVFQLAEAPGPADNPLKGLVPYAGQGQKFPYSLEFDYLSLEAARSLGYELQVVHARASLTSRRIEVSVTITNRGVAPFYAGWPVRLLAVGSAGGESVARLPFALNTLLPAAADTRSVTLDLAKVMEHDAAPRDRSGGVHQGRHALSAHGRLPAQSAAALSRRGGQAHSRWSKKLEVVAG